MSIIVGRARNGVIGRDNAIPWHLPEDLKHFKATTMGCPIVMGRKTFESIGRPLPGRQSIVLSRDPSWSQQFESAYPGSRSAASLTQALDMCVDAKEVFVIGGAQLFAEALLIAKRLVLTDIDLEPEGDVLFPPIDARQWRVVHRTALTSRNGIAYEIIEYQRTPAS